MKKITPFLFIFAIALPFLQCAADGTSSVDTSIKTTIDIQNDFSEDLVVEIWAGESLSYDNTQVSGTSLEKLEAVTVLTTGILTSFADLVNDGKDILLVFAKDNSGSYQYFNEYTLSSPSGTVDLTIESSGQITRNE